MTAAVVSGATVLAAMLLAAAVILWPPGRQQTTVSAARRAPRGHAASGVAVGRGVGAGGEEPLRRRLRRWLQWDLRRQRPVDWVADFAELSAVGLDAGLPSLEAARLACSVGGDSDPETRRLADRLGAAEAAGQGVGECLAAHARSSGGTASRPPGTRGRGPGNGLVAGRNDLDFLAAAWQLTDEFGVAAAPAARTAAQVLRERAAAHERRTVLAAGPRASMWLLTLLPLSGPVVAVLLGLDVGQVYGEVATTSAAGVGLLLTVCGWFWSRALLRRALRPTEVT